jgi:hypothetical protein
VKKTIICLVLSAVAAAYSWADCLVIRFPFEGEEKLAAEKAWIDYHFRDSPRTWIFKAELAGLDFDVWSGEVAYGDEESEVALYDYFWSFEEGRDRCVAYVNVDYNLKVLYEQLRAIRTLTDLGARGAAEDRLRWLEAQSWY